MACYLRVNGENLDVDRLVTIAGFDDALDVISIFRRGEPRFPNSQPDGPRNEQSGMSIRISAAGFDEFDKQIDEAFLTLNEEREMILTLQSFDGVDEIGLDFGIDWRDCVAQFDHLPAELIRVCGELGLSIEISHYPVARPKPSK
jgi:hypothetical protein